MERDRKNEKKWSEMTYEERRAQLPEHLNKIGEWFLKQDKEQYLIINDEEAILE
ncbi:MAG: hypothetical protein LUC49_06285 [Prevotella sp.]|nr:hypothetical protein [Prevotella sp.]